MESESLILGVIIVALCLLFVIWPFLSVRRESGAQQGHLNGELERLIAQRDAIYATIRDLDFDFQTGKLADEDYRAQREAWVARGVDVLKALDALQQAAEPVPIPAGAAAGGPASPGLEADLLDYDAQIESAVAARRRAT